jgi:hypothetical protein
MPGQTHAVFANVPETRDGRSTSEVALVNCLMTVLMLNSRI